uniref:Uncharacterized protein n=1 Tax=Thermogemmatispora argillosa TaxID=2045280 RepID=A0A455T3U9_9CHLR|nr:hypothetical protein KTA_20900 [Thermogemmatispora argillosa]
MIWAGAGAWQGSEEMAGWAVGRLLKQANLSVWRLWLALSSPTEKELYCFSVRKLLKNQRLSCV